MRSYCTWEVIAHMSVYHVVGFEKVGRSKTIVTPQLTPLKMIFKLFGTHNYSIKDMRDATSTTFL